jgi:hypothetical protein
VADWFYKWGFFAIILILAVFKPFKPAIVKYSLATAIFKNLNFTTPNKAHAYHTRTTLEYNQLSCRPEKTTP